MFAKAVLPDEERAVDPHLGFPRGYAKLCRHAHVQAQGLISPFTEGPPQCFHPYAPQDEEIAKFKGYDDLFPILDEEQRDASNSKKHIDSLWQQLDHMENAGFDPAIFRVDAYGNVLYWDADPGSPLAWDVDHWFPHARGGKTVLRNLRIVQWQACQRKGKKLEFLVPWWDLQLGVSVNQFLSVFASKNTNFRHRAFSFFFPDGVNEELNSKKVVQGHSWPRNFRDRKNRVGLAAAALVQVQKAPEGALRSVNSNYRVAKQDHLPVNLTGHCDEAVRRDLQNLGLEYFKDNNDKQSSRGQRHLDKENKLSSTDRFFENSAVQLQRELIWKHLTEEDKKHKMEESIQLEEELQLMKAQNAKEKAVLDQLEHELAKQKKRVEKQRQWSETQSQYRLCLEKMIRDTLHQCVVYKEQARLNQAACDALMARLDSQKSACDAAETDLLRKVKQREDLEATARSKITKRGRQQGHTDVGSCLKPDVAIQFKPPRNTSKIPLSEGEEKSCNNELDHHNSKMRLHSGTLHQQPNHVELKDVAADKAVYSKQELRMTCPKLLVRDKYSTKLGEMQGKEASEMLISGHKREGIHPAEIGREQPLEEEPEGNMITAHGFPGMKRKALEGTDELDVVLLGYEYQENEDERANANKEESVGDNGTTHISIMNNFSDNDEDAAANKDTLDNSYSYEESNNADNLSEKEIEGSKEGETGMSEVGDVDEGERGSFNAGDEGKALVSISKTHENEKLVESFDGHHTVEKTTDEQRDELLQQVLVMHDKVNEAMVEAIREEQDEERVKRVGKLNLDKWLEKLLLNSGYGLGEEPTSLISLQNIADSANNSLEGVKHISHSAIDRNRGSTQKGNMYNCRVEEKIDSPTVQDVNHELVEAARRGMIGGLWKKISSKNGGSPVIVDTEHPKSGFGVEKTRALNDAKKPEERRISPWRWISPVSKRSTSAGGETRTRCLSPWRRNSKEDKAEERKMMESFSKLKLGGDKRQAEGIAPNAPQNNEVFDNSVKATEQGLFAKPKSRAQTPPLAQGMRERSISTPHMKTQCGQLALLPAPIRNDALIAKAHPFTKQVQRRKDNGDTGKDVGGATHTMANVDACGGAFKKANALSGISDVGGTTKHAMPGVFANGGAVRKASMLKKSASTRGGGVEQVSVACGGTHIEEENELHKASIFEDLDAQDGMRASLSLAWKKAVKKFELGKAPAP